MPIMFLSRGYSTYTLVDSEVDAPRHYVLTGSGEIAFNFSSNDGEERLNSPGLERMTWNLEGLRRYQLDHQTCDRLASGRGGLDRTRSRFKFQMC